MQINRLEQIKHHVAEWLIEHNKYIHWRILKILIELCFKCSECWDGEFWPQYGIAPHHHYFYVDKNGRNRLGKKDIPKSEWPEEYDDCDDGAGVYWCPNPKCVNARPGKKDVNR